MKKLSLVFSCLILAMLAGVATAGNFFISHLGVESGLSNNHVVGIAQDKHGFIWIATDEGLNRFDGRRFRSYFKNESGAGGGITGNELNCIIDDPCRNVLWIATQRSGLNAYDYSADRFSSYRHDDSEPTSLSTDDVTSLVPAADGGIWVTTYYGGVDHFDPDAGKFDHYNSYTVAGMPDAPVWSVADCGDGYLYVGHENAGFSIIDLGRMSAMNLMPDAGNRSGSASSSVWRVYKDSFGNIWVGSSAGLQRYNPYDSSFTDFGQWHPELRHLVTDIRQFSDNRLWVAMERGGIAIIDLPASEGFLPENLQVTHIAAGSGSGDLSNPSVKCLFADSFSNVWAGTWGGGVNFISSGEPAFRLHSARHFATEREQFSNNRVLAVLFDDDGRLWLGKDGGGLEVYDGDMCIASYGKNHDSSENKVVQASCKSSDGKLWFGLFNAGVLCYDPATGKFSEIFPPGSHVDVRDIVEDFSGDMLIGTSRGVYRHNKAERMLISPPYQLGNQFVRKILPLPEGRYLVGTFGSGMMLTDRYFNVVRFYDTSTGFPSNTVNDMFRGRDGKVWVGTGEGLVCFDDIMHDSGNYAIMNRSDGLANSHVHAIAQDKEGNVWFSTNSGISCRSKGRFYNYSHLDNLPFGNFLDRSVASDSDGKLYFGALNGLCVCNPVKALETIETPEPEITEITVYTAGNDLEDAPLPMQVTGRRSVGLRYNQNTIEIAFTCFNYAIERRVEYAYMLDGFDNQWFVAKNGNTATFRDLPSGRYRFMVKTRIHNQAWGAPVSLEVVIAPQLWLTWWAKCIYGLIVLGIVATLLYLYRKRVNAEARLRAEQEHRLRQQELNEERLRFYTNITHELRTPLTLILGPLDDLAKDRSLPEKDRRSLGVVNRNAKRLLDLVNGILEFRKTETQNRKLCVVRRNIAATVYEAGLKYKELNRNQDVAINITTMQGDMSALFDKEVVTIVLDNLISNAMKYTEKGSIDIGCSIEGANISITVADTGFGIPADALAHVFDRYWQEGGNHQAEGTGIGLALVRNLVALHHGTVEVKSEVGKGTVFKVLIPANGSYPEALHAEEEPARAVDAPAADVSLRMNATGDRKPIVLVVEDNADILDYIKQAFTDLYDVRCATNGADGLQMALETVPDVIVSDVMMPRMDGVEMCRRLKSDVRTSHVPVILLTAKETDDDREEGYRSGADSYLTKPFSSMLLQIRINNLLLQRAKLAETFSAHASEIASSTGSIDEMARKREKLVKGLGEVDRDFIDRLTSLITDNVQSETVDVNFLSGALCMSPSTLYRKVKALTGLSPNEFLRKTRMRLSEELLLTGRYTLSEIVFKVGMNSMPYFRQCFKDEFGMSPTEYLKKISEIPSSPNP